MFPPAGNPGITRSDGASLDELVAFALGQGGSTLDRLPGCLPRDEVDAVSSLLRIHDLHLMGRDGLQGNERWQHHPVIAGLKWALEDRFIARLEAAEAARDWELPDEPAAAIRTIAALDRVPPVYAWLAREAPREEMLEFLALEGGPDGGFDDLVAIAQVGLTGGPKLELARNYWDEMGRGEPAAVHSTLHGRLVAALGVPQVLREDQPLEALDRAALGSLLATNRWLQPEMLGVLGLIELQAGPRCRQVVAGMERLGMSAEALPFYQEHAATDPRHGRQWLDHVIAPLGTDPETGRRMVRGARWRSTANARFLAAVAERLGVGHLVGAEVGAGGPDRAPATPRTGCPPVAA